jgi:hypothetical protein
MRIHVYAVCWNEEVLLPYFLRHYGRFAQRIIVYDNESDDASLKIARAFPQASVRIFQTGHEMRDDVLLDIKNNDWKESRGEADWVIVVDIDEFLWHEDLLAHLGDSRKRGVALPAIEGFEMLADAPPKQPGQIYDEIQWGAPEPLYAKRCIFDPDAIREINYGAGCHAACPLGNVVEDHVPGLKLLHFRFLGRRWIQERWQARSARLSAQNRGKNWSLHYQMHQDAIDRWVKSLKQNAIQVVP